ncbi:MAG: polyamine aminopropyltransferase [Candidatus Syntropharchaeia archaeon]
MELWFEDKLEMERGCTLRIKINKALESIHSKIQRIDVLESRSFGKILVLDGVTMLTEYDEFCYHEMIVHVPLCVHPDPQDVLVIGGGDGGTVREVLRHDVERVDLCEIDEKVIEVCRRHLPSVAGSFEDERVNLFFEDGAEFVKRKENEYDVIIVDSSDPEGPAEVLFKKEFYESLHRALKQDGIVVSQMESFFYHIKIIKSVFSFVKDMFPISEYYYTLVPTYPSGMIGFVFCSKKYHPILDLREERIPEGLRYYNERIHKASFILPNFVLNEL